MNQKLESHVVLSLEDYNQLKDLTRINNELRAEITSLRKEFWKNINKQVAEYVESVKDKTHCLNVLVDKEGNRLYQIKKL